MSRPLDGVRIIRRHDPRPADRPARLADEAEAAALDQFICAQLQAAIDAEPDGQRAYLYRGTR